MGPSRALIIGFNYKRKSSASRELKGTYNDACNMWQLLIDLGYPEDEIEVILDDKPNPLPTARYVMEALKWLIDGVTCGYRLFLYYAGHGGREQDGADMDEVSGKDDTLIMPDGSIIIDDWLNDLLQLLPEGVNFTAVFDCCHSGTALDLPHNYGFKTNKETGVKTLEEVMEKAPGEKATGGGQKKATKPEMEINEETGVKTHGEVMEKESGKNATGGEQPEATESEMEIYSKNAKNKRTRCHAVLLSACADAEVAWDAKLNSMRSWEPDFHQGVMTANFIKWVYKNMLDVNSAPSYQAMFRAIGIGVREWCEKKLPIGKKYQTPQMSSGKLLGELACSGGVGFIGVVSG